MNVNFEQEFINQININVTDKYLDEYLQTSRYNLLMFNNLNHELYVLQNNHIVNNNKHLFQFVDTVKKEALQYKLKQLVLKQRKLYHQFMHYYNTSVINTVINNVINNVTNTTSTSDNTSNTTEAITKNTKLMRVQNLKSIENTREVKLQQNLLQSNSIIHKIKTILTSNTPNSLNTSNAPNTPNTSNINDQSIKNNTDISPKEDSKIHLEKEVTEHFIRNISSSRISIDSKRSTFTISSRKSTDSNKSSDSNTSKKSYKINRPDKQESINDKKGKFTKFFIKK